ncbi:MAG: glycerate kinase [Propionicimonas sp.]
MKIVCAPDSFKESLSAAAAAHALERGIRAVWPGAEVVRVPMADGGEGTCQVLAEALGGDLVEVECADALGRPRTAVMAHLPDQRLAVIEVATACGLEWVEPPLRDARTASSSGVGQLLRRALDLGVSRILLGLGGSATNDAGAGMMTALGARFLDATGAELPAGGAALAGLDRIDLSGLDPRVAGVRITLASDVDNPLLGERGASAVFGPQKGASPEAVAELDAALTRWAEVVEPAAGRSVRYTPGAGAAGGLGAAFLAFFDTTLESGTELVMDAVGMSRALVGADYVFTGEGGFDAQSAAGKVPVRVARRAHAAGVPTIVFAGRVDPVAELDPELPVAAVVPIVRGVGSLADALAEGAANLERASALVCRLLEVAASRPKPAGD